MAVTDKACMGAATDSAACLRGKHKWPWPGDYCLLPFLLMPSFMLSSPVRCAAFE